MIDISIVLITWKMKNLLAKLLDSVKDFSKGFSYEIIVVDNNSQDGTIELIENKYPEIVLIKNKENLGVAPARNIGMKQTKGKYVLILDADMQLKENSILKMFEFMEENLSCGLVGSKLIYENGDLQYSCKRFPSLMSLFARRLEGINLVRNSKILTHHIMSDWDHKSVNEVDYVIGACQFIRSEVIEKIGYYDDKIFYGPEDLDFCLRVWRAGWQVIYFPKTSITHFEQRITKKTLFSKITIKHLLGIFYIFRKYNGKLTRYSE